MNKLLTYAGIMPVYLGDINFMQNAAADAFKQLARALMNSGSDSLNAILQGVELNYDSVSVDWSAGIVVLNGEILPVAAGSAIYRGSSGLYFHVNSVLSGDRTFKDGNSHQCYDTRSAIINTDSAGGIPFNSVPRLHNEAVVDDRVYVGTDVSGTVTSGNLIRKNGLWFMDVALNIPDNSGGSGMTGSVVFSLTQSHYNAIDPSEFIVDAFVYNNTDGYQSQLLKCGITKSGGRWLVTISFESANGEQTAYGTGSIKMLLPSF